MQKLLLLIFLFYFNNSNSQDIVILKNSNTLKEKIKTNKLYFSSLGFGFNFQDLNSSKTLNNFVVNGFVPIQFSYENLIINKSKGLRGLEISFNKNLIINESYYTSSSNNNKIRPYQIAIIYKFYAQDYYSYYIGPLIGINAGMSTFGTSLVSSGSSNNQPIFGFKFGYSPLFTDSFGVNIEGNFIIGMSSNFYSTTSIQIGPYLIF